MRGAVHVDGALDLYVIEGRRLLEQEVLRVALDAIDFRSRVSELNDRIVVVHRYRVNDSARSVGNSVHFGVLSDSEHERGMRRKLTGFRRTSDALLEIAER